ncbi:MAG: cation:proton antiporter [Planctomycetes bacterium]|nr:cation:proton antiporter [Planctomycetota bacterium]
MQHGPELTIVLVACVVLAIGAGVKLAAKRFKFPYSIAMLVLGLLMGGLLSLLHHHDLLPHELGELGSSAPLSSDLILFVFVPTLVFESALSLNTYSFARNMGPIATLAVPAMLATAIATAFMMHGLTFVGWEWSLPTALVFGALISATDPVAVVALLRDVGAPKRLSLLIEGESLLNDATAIVLFTLLIAFAAGSDAGHLDLTQSVLGFLKVLLGGFAVGMVISLGLTWLLSRVFNEPTVEITLTIVMAYGAMVLAEHYLHVSGVIAIVTMGLWLSGPGRTAISPEVRGRQHHFFGMLAYIANTLIFFLAGVVIVTEFQHFQPIGILIVLLAWIGIMVIRFIVTFLFQPVMNKLGPRVSLRQSAVISWGGLRGAVSLALALVVAGNPDIPAETRSQILRATAGVVMLTILINGTTTGWLLRKLGFTKRPIGERLQRLQAQARILERVEADVERLSGRARYRTIHWNEIRESLNERRRTVEEHTRRTRAEVSADQPDELLQLAWYQAIAIERTAYRESNETGMISGTTLQILEFEIDSQLERLAVKDTGAPTSRAGRALAFRNFMLKLARKLPFGTNKIAFRDLSRLYELAWVESLAAGRVLNELEQAADRESEAVRTVAKAYRGFRREAHERLEDLRGNAPEVASAIEKRLGHRVELNLERGVTERLEHEGVVPEAVCEDFLKIVEERMAKLAFSPVRGSLPGTAELLRSIPLFRGLDEEMIESLSKAAREIVFARDEVLMKEGEPGDAMYLIARGAAHVVKGSGDDEQLLDVLGGGEILGEMALISGEARTATVRAATTLTALKIHLDDLRKLMDEAPAFKRQIEDAFARHVFDNLLRSDPAWRHLNHQERLEWIRDREQQLLQPDDKVEAGDAAWAFLLAGALKLPEGVCTAPALMRAGAANGLSAARESRIVLLDEPPAHMPGPRTVFLLPNRET